MSNKLLYQSSRAFALSFGLGYTISTLYGWYHDSKRLRIKEKNEKGILNGKTPNVIIIGAGFSGICMAIKLQEVGIPFIILEKGPDFGGTWLWNTYPGCACDVPAHLYSFSFDLNPNWSKPYAPQSEILAYIQAVAKKYKLYEHVRFNTEVLESSFLSDKNQWQVTCKDGTIMTSRIVMFGVGPLHIPSFPNDVKGLDQFSGEQIHSANWDNKANLEGKRVIVVGSAASAIQIVPEVARVAKHLTIVQRTPSWIAPQRAPILPSPDGYPQWMIVLFNLFPILTRFHRWTIFLMMEALHYPIGIFGDPKTSTWARNSQALVRRVLTKYMTMKLGHSKKAKEIQDIVIPAYPVGCKRIVRSEKYLGVLTQENVDIMTKTPKELRDRTMVLSDGSELDADVIIWATGFKVGSLGNLHIKGENGKEMKGDDLIHSGVKAYLGVTPIEAPNAFFLLGPNTGLGHNSIILMIEHSCNYLAQLLCNMADSGAERIEVKKEALEKYQAGIEHTLQHSIWNGNCSSWYQAKDGSIPTLWPHTTVAFWYSLRTPVMEDYILSPMHINSTSKPAVSRI